MDIPTTPDAIWVQTQVFPSWSVIVPRSLTPTDAETAAEAGYWHARDEHRSVSFTSLIVVDASSSHSIPAATIVGQVAQRVLPRGRKVTDQPQDLPSRAVFAKRAGSGVASHALQGIVAADGVVLIATITSDDEAWCRRVWSSIRHTPEVAAAMEAEADADRVAADRAEDRTAELVGAQSG